ncbi:hypothetical protein F4781DRAFT_133926 [Annulohypoxylon bovei var. microspora]|nr:hypothetical protein F4781DRAFT_133926 [Annulohypoxylon bovei var. microspora]
MSNRSIRDPQREESRRHPDSRRVHTTDRPSRREVTHQVYTRISGSILSNYYQGSSAPFVWEHSDRSSSAHGQVLSAGPPPQRQDDGRIEEWMERMNVNDPVTSTGQTNGTGAGTNTLAIGGVDPNTLAPSVVGSHCSGESVPSRPNSPERPPPVIHRPPGQEPVRLRRPGYVPPERRAERERANQVIVSESSERRHRRREERDRDRRRHH